MQLSKTTHFLTILLVCAAFAFSMVSFVPHAHAQLEGGNQGQGLTGGNGGNQGGGGSGCGGSGGLQNPLGSTCDLAALLTAILTFVTTKIGPVIVTLMLVYCGFLFVTAQGNAEKVSTARTALLWTVIGALILLGATALQGVITSTISTL